MENKFYYIEYKNNGISGDAFVYTETVDGLDENVIITVDNKSVEELKDLHKYELEAHSAMASQFIEKLQIENSINLQAFENLNRKLVEANERIVEFENIKKGHLEVQEKLNRKLGIAMKALDIATLIDCPMWQKENDEHLPLALHGISNSIVKAIGEIEEIK